MNKYIFDYDSYKPYLKDKLNFLNKKEWGYKQSTANFIGCQASYLSQILSGKPDLTLEQAHKLNSRFLHDKIEAKYFILMVEMGRANTHELKSFFLEQIQEIQANRYDLKKRLKSTEQVSKENMDQYYSSWLYSAIHIALALPHLQDAKAIAQRFNIPEKMAAEIIFFLETAGLVERKNGQYVFTKMRLHLDRNSNFIQRHHINWRSQALQSVEKNFTEDMHFSTVFAITKTDFNKIKEIFIKSIESAREVIGPSESQELYSITFDLFKVS
jgi:uncharacterized protein (TIGR02147 family)